MSTHAYYIILWMHRIMHIIGFRLLLCTPTHIHIHSIPPLPSLTISPPPPHLSAPPPLTFLKASESICVEIGDHFHRGLLRLPSTLGLSRTEFKAPSAVLGSEKNTTTLVMLPIII